MRLNRRGATSPGSDSVSTPASSSACRGGASSATSVTTPHRGRTGGASAAGQGLGAPRAGGDDHGARRREPGGGPGAGDPVAVEGHGRRRPLLDAHAGAPRADSEGRGRRGGRDRPRLVQPVGHQAGGEAGLGRRDLAVVEALQTQLREAGVEHGVLGGERLRVAGEQEHAHGLRREGEPLERGVLSPRLVV